MSEATGLPDLLRRFAATPYHFRAFLYPTIVYFETNDQKLFATFRTRTKQLADALVFSDKPWFWKVVRDYDVSQNGNDSFLLSGERLSATFVGTGTVVAIDWERRELLGFVAANVSAEHLLDALIDVGQQHHHLKGNFGITAKPHPTQT